MNARSKLNAAVIQGIALISLVIGALAGSWSVGIVAAVILTSTSITSGSIRIRKHRR